MISREITTMDFVWKILFFVFFSSLMTRTFLIESPVMHNFQTQLAQLVYNEDANMQPRELMVKYGYKGETHRVTTEDGYILEMHRITGPNNNSSPEGKQPILLMHGLLTSSVDWIIIGPSRAFGYLLADEGYDVWMGNNRGNTFSRKHKKYSFLDKDYWQFSWHEIGCRDLPAMIDYILDKTNRSKLVYVGHSQGTTDFFVMASQFPNYQNKIKAMFALAPIAYLDHVKSLFYRIVAQFTNSIEKIMNLLGWYEFEPSGELLKKLISAACDSGAWSQPFCTNVIFLVAGFGSDQLNTTMLTAILGHVPAGASAKQIAHYGQVIKARRFQQYDHGIIGNWKKYRSLRPPIYDLARVKVPVYLHYSSNDWMSDSRDVDRLYRELGNAIAKFRVPHENFGHLDFLWAKDGKKLLYQKVIGLMKRYDD